MLPYLVVLGIIFLGFVLWAVNYPNSNISKSFSPSSETPPGKIIIPENPMVIAMREYEEKLKETEAQLETLRAEILQQDAQLRENAKTLLSDVALVDNPVGTFLSYAGQLDVPVRFIEDISIGGSPGFDSNYNDLSEIYMGGVFKHPPYFKIRPVSYIPFNLCPSDVRLYPPRLPMGPDIIVTMHSGIQHRIKCTPYEVDEVLAVLKEKWKAAQS